MKTIIISILLFISSFLHSQDLNQMITNEASTSIEEIMNREERPFKLNLPKLKFNDPVKPFSKKGLAKIGLGALCGLGSGAAYAYNQLDRHHYYKLETVHPNINASFWGPDQWFNHWKLDDTGYPIVGEERFWGSSRWFIVFTDAHHATMAIDHLLTTTGLIITYSGTYHNLLIDIVKGAIFGIARSVGFYIIHESGWIY